MPQAIESLGEEAWSGSGVFEVETIGVEFGEAGCGDDDAWGVFGLEDVEGEVDAAKVEHDGGKRHGEEAD